MSYAILRTDRFNDQLNDIIFYIADDAGDVDAALRVLDRIEADVMALKQFPERGNLPRYSTLRRQGYRILVVMRWLVFYKVEPDRRAVTLYAIVDQRQEYLRLL